MSKHDLSSAEKRATAREAKRLAKLAHVPEAPPVESPSDASAPEPPAFGVESDHHETIRGIEAFLPIAPAAPVVDEPYPHELPRHVHKAGGVFKQVNTPDECARALASGWLLRPPPVVE